MYKYLLWDIDGTILDFIAAESCAIKALFKKYDLGECTDQMVSVYSEINTKYWKKLEKNEITKPEVLTGRFREFFDIYGIDTSIINSFNSDYQLALGDYIIYVDNAKEILLSQKGKFVLCAVTNGTKIAQEKKLRVSGLDKIFDHIFISENVGYEKPNMEYFEYVFNTLGITDKKEVLIIGDSLTSDIKGGYNAGIDTCWFNPLHKENNLNIPVSYEIDTLEGVNDILEG